MELQEDLKHVCVFCYKVVDEKVEFNNNDSSQIVEKFCKFLRRLPLKECNIPIPFDTRLSICEDCVKIVHSFNELYHQIQCLQLQLDWRLDKLKMVMKCADKIPSRVKAFRIRYQTSVLGNEDCKEKNIMMEMRNQIKLQVIRYTSNALPRVRLDNYVPQDTNFSRGVTLPNCSQLSANQQCTNTNYNFFFGWITTFIAVVVCYFPSDNCYDLCAPISADLFAPDKSQSSEKSSCALDLSIVAADANIVMAKKEKNQSERSILFSLLTSPAESFHDTFPSTPESDVGQESEMCDNNETFHQINYTHPLITVPSQSEHDPSNEPMSPENVHHTQNISTSLTEEVYIASDEFAENTTVYASSNCNLIAHTNRDLNHTHVSTLQSSEHSPETIITQTPQINGSTCDKGALHIANEVPSTSRQLRSIYKCIICNQTFSSLARLDAHKTSCALQNFSETEEEEKAARNVKNDGDYMSSPQKVESDEYEEIDQHISEDSSDLPSSEDEISYDDDGSRSDIQSEEQEFQKISTRQRLNTKMSKTSLKQEGDLKHQSTQSLEELTRMYKETNGQVELSKASVITLKLTGVDIRLKLNNSELELQVCNIGGCEPSLFSNDDHLYHQRLHGNFQCSLCDFNCTFAPTLITHELEHNSDNQDISCPKCLNVKIDKISYKTHFLEHHLKPSVDWRPAKCPVCFMSFPNEDSVPLTHFVNQHDLSRLNNPETTYNCVEENCSAYFLTRQQTVAHAQEIHNKKCEIVLRRARTKVTNNFEIPLRILNLVEKRNAKFYCPVDTCNGQYFSQKELDIHSKLHGNFKCQFCPVEKTWAFDLAFHELEHGNYDKSGKMFNCRRCLFVIIHRNMYFAHHLKNHLNVSPDKIKCPICQYSFMDLGEKYRDLNVLNKAIRKHYLLHHNDFRSAEDLIEMYKNSNGQLQLSEASVKFLKITGADIKLKEVYNPLQVCNLEGCDGLFSSNELEYHISLHGQFSCFFCEYQYNYVPSLISHELSCHISSQKEFSCPRCPDMINNHNYKNHFLENHLDKSVKFRGTKCPICSMPFPENDQVPLTHYVNEHDLSRLRDPKKTEMCNEEGCSAYFLTSKQLIDHSQIVHNKTKKFSYKGKLLECLHSCDVCQTKFASVSTLICHKRMVHRKRTFESNAVGDVIIGSDGMTVDDFVTKRKAKFHCSEENCDEKFFTEKERESHVKLHSTFHCNFCPVVKTFAPDLALHELQHGKNDKHILLSSASRISYNCNRCAFSSTRKNMYISHHLEKHLNLSPDNVRCHICHMNFKVGEGRSRLLNPIVLRHYLLYHDTSELKDKTALFNCVQCPAYFLEEHQLLSHNLTIHAEESIDNLSLACQDCNLLLLSRQCLFFHRLKLHHNNDDSGYQFVCKLANCQKRFEYKADRDHHSVWHFKHHTLNLTKAPGQSHSGTMCEQCGKTFKCKTYLAKHMLSHSGPGSWQFTCEVCSKKCLTKQKLDEHMRTHTKAKPYICEKCGATYAHRHNWRQHMSSKHGVKVPTQNFVKVNMTSQKGMKRKRFTAPDST